MIKSLTAISELGKQVKIVLPIDDPDHGLLLVGMDGLGPAKANVNTSVLSTADGDVFNSARLDKRNVVIHFKFTNDIETTRHLTYDIFSVKKQVQLIVETDEHTLTTTGYVESNEPNIFDQNEGCDISIICPDPYLYLYDTKSITVSISQGTFHFPFSSEVIYRTNWDMLRDTYPSDPSEMDIVLYKHKKEINAPIEDGNYDGILDNLSDTILGIRIVDEYSPQYTPDGQIVVKPSYDKYLTAEVIGDLIQDNDGDYILDNYSDQIGSIIVTLEYKDPQIENYGISAILDSNGDPITVRETEYKNGPRIEFGIIKSTPYNTIGYEGSIRIGCVMHLLFLGDVRDSVIIYNEATEERIVINASKFYEITGTYFQPGDEIIINTIPNHKTVYLHRNTEYINILHCVDKPISWISIVNGNNIFYFNTTTSNNNRVQLEVYYQTAFEGI